jgi:thiol-disulfide isomerase/thioredoxin
MKKIITPILLALSVSTNVFALNVNDTVPTALSKYIKIDNNQNKLYIIDFFASWCGSCKKELPLISKINKTINKNQVEIIGIDVDKNVKSGIKFQKKLNLDFRIINDPQGNVISVFNPIGMPTIYYVKNNKIIKIIPGAIKDIDEQILSDIATFKTK